MSLPFEDAGRGGVRAQAEQRKPSAFLRGRGIGQKLRDAERAVEEPRAVLETLVGRDGDTVAERRALVERGEHLAREVLRVPHEAFVAREAPGERRDAAAPVAQREVRRLVRRL